MQLGISTYSFPWAVGVADFKPKNPLTAQELLHYATQKNIQRVQFGDNYPLHHLSEKELRELKALADDWHLQIEVGTRGLTKANIDRYLSIAGLLESPFLRVVIDDLNYHPAETEVLKVIHELIPALKAKKLRLAIENHDRFPAKTLKHIIESTDPEWIGICLDTANSLGAGEGIEEVVSQLASYTINLHIKDFIIKRVHHKMGFKISGCAAGTGMLNIPWLVAIGKQQHKCTTATLEVWSDPELTIEETIQKEKDWVEQSIDYLKTIIS